MDRRTVLTKTARGLMEVTGKTSLLARDQRSLLSHIDGKATIGDLQHKIGKLSESKLNQMLGRLIRDGFIREFVSAPNSVSPPSQLGTRHDLDFSEFIPQDKAREAVAQAVEAEQIARAMYENRARVDEARAQRAPQSGQHAADDNVRREAEAKAKTRRAAEDQARRELVAKVKREAEEKARLEAEAKARRIAEDQARRELVAKVKREAEEKVRLEAETQAKREAEEQARREAEARAKHQAEEKTRKEAEVAAKREAEVRAFRDAEAKAKRIAEETARLEAKAKAKRAAEEKARLEAEAQAKREAEEKARREAEAGAKREAEEKARREAAVRAKRAAEEKAHQVAEARARAKREAEDKARREAEAKAKREAEEKARQEAKAQARAEQAEQARIEAEARARREAAEQAEHARRGWQVRAEQERAEQMRREAEQEDQREAGKAAKQRLLEDERTRARADAERAARERREQRAREKAESDARAGARKRERERESATVVARLHRIRRGKPDSAGKWLAGFVVAALVVGILAVPFLPVDTARYEQLAERVLGVPVEIGEASYAWTPWPALELGNVSVGPAREARIDKVVAVPSALSIWSDLPTLQRLDLQGFSARPSALAVMLTGKLDAKIPGLRKIGLAQVSLDTPGVTLPALHGRIELGSASSGGKLVLADNDGALSLEITPQGNGEASFDLGVTDASALLGIPLMDVAAKGNFSAQKADISAFDGRLYDGMLKGRGVLNWNPQLSFEGTVDATSVTTIKVTPIVGGRLNGSAAFNMQAALFDDLFAMPHVTGRFNIESGVMHGLDLPRSLQAGSVALGATPFNDLSGQFVLESGRLRLHGMRLHAGIMKASGTAELAGGKEIDGRIAAELRIPAGFVRANFGIGGTPQALTVKR